MAFYYFMRNCFQDLSVEPVSSVREESCSGESSPSVFFRDGTQGC